MCPVAACQPHYNMLQREIEADILPWCLAHNVALVVYWPLMKGLLAGKLARNHVFNRADGRAKYPMYQGDQWQKNQDLVDALRAIAREADKTVPQVVINWTINRPGITAALCGAKRPDQLRENAARSTGGSARSSLPRSTMLLRCAAKQSREVRCEIAFLLLHGKLTTAPRGVCFSGCSCASAVCSLPQEVGREAVERVVSARLLVALLPLRCICRLFLAATLASAARPALEPSASAVLFDSSASRLLADFSSPASSTIARNPLRVAQRDARKATEPAVPDSGRLRLFHGERPAEASGSSLSGHR